MKRLRQMLKYKRPHGSFTEQKWIKDFIMPYEPDAFGEGEDVFALAVTVMKSDGSMPEVLFSAHTDTVHRQGGKQRVLEKDGFFYKNDREPLGADDAAGVWILLEMIDAGVPGVYLFHRGEECGGIGSSWMRKNGEDWLSQFKYAIAFDRKATHSIITHQGSRRTCSNEFASALADALNEQNENFMYVDDDTGVFTDTKNYVDVIKECTNVSVGYYDEHRPAERLDINHVVALRDACLKIDWHALPAARDETKTEYKSWGGFGGKWGGWQGSWKPAGKGLPVQDDPLGIDQELEEYFNARYGRLL